jgi:hypothetical protein
MKLTPSIPPGRSNRKARAYSTEIARLSREGYGCKAIHQALLDAGASVSKSTVQRELARLPMPAPAGPNVSHAAALLAAAHPVRAELDTEPPLRAAQNQPSDGDRNGKDLAAEFMKGRHTNPLFRNRS